MPPYFPSAVRARQEHSTDSETAERRRTTHASATVVDGPPKPTERVDVLGCAIDPVDLHGAVRRCQAFIVHRSFGQHMAVNAAKLVASHDDPQLREMINRCELVTADGQAVVWASRILRKPLPERVAGIDLMNGLFELAAREGYGVFILGARKNVLEQAVARLRSHYPGLPIVGYRDGYFLQSEEAAVAAEIARAQPAMLFVAISSPRKEYFLARFGHVIDVPFVMGVGGAIDVVSGITRRAPPIIQRLGLEWLFRLVQEPRRLMRRYVVTNARFLGLVLGAAGQRNT